MFFLLNNSPGELRCDWEENAQRTDTDQSRELLSVRMITRAVPEGSADK